VAAAGKSGDCRLSCGCRDVASSPLGDRLLAARAPPSLRVLRPSFFLAAPVLFIALSETLRRFIRGATASEALHFIHQKSCGEVRPDLWFSDPALARVLVNQAGPPPVPTGKGERRGRKTLLPLRASSPF
jgi:hypothetical protein